MPLHHLPAETSPELALRQLDEEGYCIIDRRASVELIDAVNAEMKPFLDRAHYGQYHAQGLRTRRCGALIARSPSSHRLIQDPLVLAVADGLLRRSATVMQLNLTQIIAIGPDEQAQFLHRDEMTWDFFRFPLDYHAELSTIWALDDFTEANGATRIVPGSHLSDRPHDSYDLSETFAAEMPKGSVLIYSGKTIHGGGANRTPGLRCAANIDYCVGWLRQEENQYLSTPIEIARTLDPELLKLMGYSMGAAAVGYVRDYEDPVVALYPDLGPRPVDESLLTAAASRSDIAARTLNQVN